ncbi:hypothetical protein [Pseudooceanicola sp. HF7]|uniref:hypothetical protein n=1 Tax=Pseudooceanicola sp. HF7 TaxID=2721560 RepID=UPI00143135DB|nr:hypothetical protein [Pseudooceanicola sp. HF7]NIZ11146.1 hypothetical protein [Pseudooceanicola sp. HF7]
MIFDLKNGLRGLKGAAAGLVLAALAGCAPGGSEGSMGFLSSTGRPTGTAVTAAKLVEGDVVVRGPSGYCVERGSVRSRNDTGFAMLARCDLLGGISGSPVALGVLTVTVTPYAEADLPAARDLARGFGPGKVLGVAQSRDVRLLHMASGGDEMVGTADPKQWRGAFLLNGYLVSMAAYGPADGALAGDGGSRVLVRLAEAIRKASPDKPRPQVVAEARP